ncbi:hypothetical protein B0H14DRAFT_2665439 [Mycena olivaceomarginata]|nr:hypothetical protein B0H14DRAFT_2665439 [Mycena olivaceomarginata]
MASFEAQLEDLLQRNRTLEHTNKKLADEMALDAHRASKTLRDTEAKWNAERVLWREGCNRLLSCHHLAHLRLSAQLSTVEATLLKETGLWRQEKVARLHRDFQLTMFRVREGELEAKIEELEDALQDAQNGQQNHFSKLAEQIKSQDEDIGLLNEEKSAAEEELAKLRESHVGLQVKVESTQAKLERVTLQLDGAQTTSAELARQNDELKRGEEVETLRKQRIDLEVEVRALQLRLEKKESELQKEKNKVIKHKKNAEEFETYINERREEMEDIENQLANAKNQVETLQLELDAERAARPISPLKRRQASPIASEDEVANNFAEDVPPSPAKPPSKKPRSKGAPSKNGGRKPASEMLAGPSNAPDSDIEEVPNPKTRSRGKAKALDVEVTKAKPRSKTAGRVSEGEGESETKAAKNKGKGKAVEVVDDSDSDAVQKESPRSKTATRGKRKRDDAADGANKPRAPSEVPEVVERPKPRSKPRSKVVNGGRAGSVQPRGTTVISDAESEEPARKKKKRTIGIFPPGSQPTSFNFLSAGEPGGIDIPTVLSPVAPGRTGSTNSSLGRRK